MIKFQFQILPLWLTFSWNRSYHKINLYKQKEYLNRMKIRGITNIIIHFKPLAIRKGNGIEARLAPKKKKKMTMKKKKTMIIKTKLQFVPPKFLTLSMSYLSLTIQVNFFISYLQIIGTDIQYSNTQHFMTKSPLIFLAYINIDLNAPVIFTFQISLN